MSQHVYTWYIENAKRLEAQGIDPEGTPMMFKHKHLPMADKSSGIVRFRTVTPKQRFTNGPEVMDEIHAAAWKHREIAADHIAAALWLSTEVPVVDAPKTRVVRTKTSWVTIPLDHESIRPEDFQTALSAAGQTEGIRPSNPVYIGKGEYTGDGRPTHVFEVTYTWTEVEK
jgi:hypothetical protein